MNVKPEFSSSDLVLALAIVNGTVVAGAQPRTQAGDAKATEAEGENQGGRAPSDGRTTSHVR